ncbi:MAG: hypothetical protein AAGI24_15015 [Pseudomonadota bacterium]
MTTLYAKPCDISATGFYFESADDYDTKSKKAVKDFGQPVEEFEIQSIDGEKIACELARGGSRDSLLNSNRCGLKSTETNNWVYCHLNSYQSVIYLYIEIV